MTDLKKATLDDLFISRGSDGKLVPVDVESSLLDAIVSLVPATYGYIKSKGLNMQISAVDWPTEDKLEFVKTHVISPDVSSLTVQDINDRMGPMTLNHLVSLVVAQSVPTTRLRSDPKVLAEALKHVLSQNAIKTPNISSTKSDIPT